MMKRLLILMLVFFSLQALKAQRQGSLALNIYGGYTFQDKVNYDGFYGYVKEGFQYGGGLEYFLSRSQSLEIKYLRMDTHLPLYGPGGLKLNQGSDKGSLNFILFGGTNYFGDTHAKATPFFGADLGVGIVDMKDGGSVTKFAWDARLGVKLNTEGPMSFKMHAYIQDIISAAGSDLYVTGGGAIIGVPEYVSIFQFGLGAVISYNFKAKK